MNDELVQRFAYRENSHRCKGSARHIIDMVWLYRSLAFPSGQRGGIFLVQMIFIHILLLMHGDAILIPAVTPWLPS
jgi:hypothetical protein